MSLERALSWAAVLAGGLSPIFVVFVALVIERSRRHKLNCWTMANGSVGDQDQRHHCIEVPPSVTWSPSNPTPRVQGSWALCQDNRIALWSYPPLRPNLRDV
jgi:hypothetical protein